MNKSYEVAKVIGAYQIVKYYANAIDDGSYYGHIYTRKVDVYRNHPSSKVLEGYGVIDPKTGIAPDDSADWYETLEDAVAYVNGRW